MITPIKNKITSVVNHLFANIPLKWGFPRILHSDHGVEFKSKLMESLSQQLGIRTIIIFPHHQQANGKLESSHRFINDCI